MLILLDPAHGHTTPGKRSPNGQLLEYAYTRELARRIVATLKARGYDAELLVPEDDDIPLSERVRRINEICLTYEPSCPAPTGHPNVILISLHLNAAGDDDFFNSRSLQVFISRLRRRLEPDPRIRIVNVRGEGYKLLVNE